MNLPAWITTVFPVTWMDVAALAWFAACWIGYVRYAAAEKPRPRLASETDRFITEWMKRMMERDNRMVDVNVMRTLTRSSQFFASTTMLILGALVAMMGYAEKVVSVIAELPFGQVITERVWEMKSLLLILIFIYAFFKFSWSMRQFGLSSVLIGAAHKPTQDAADYMADVTRVSAIISFANSNFNNGLRAYYFGVAALAWFLHPVLMIVFSACVVYVLYQREFRSKTLQMLTMR